MSSQSHIEWTNATWNPVTGCTKVSQGCGHCYAERLDKRFGRDFSKIELHPERLDLPLHWRKPRMIFVNSMSDLFHEKVPFEFIFRVYNNMAAANWHTYHILTKRPERANEFYLWLRERNAMGRCPRWLQLFGEEFPKHIWVGFSAEDQATFDQRSRVMQDLDGDVQVIFASLEPMLGPIDASSWLRGCVPSSLRLWVIVGGESGPGARPMHPDWVRSIRDQCEAAGVPFFFKQWGEWGPATADEWQKPGVLKTGQQIVEGNAKCGYYCGPRSGHVDHKPQLMLRVGKKRAGAMLDGKLYPGLPSIDNPAEVHP